MKIKKDKEIYYHVINLNKTLAINNTSHDKYKD